MPRKKFLATDQFAYHVTSRSNNQEWFYIPSNLAWSIFMLQLRRTSIRYETDIHAFVLMSNHFHLILSTPRKNLDRAMRYFLTESCRSIQKAANRKNHVFGTRYRHSILDSPQSLAYVMKYVYRNPVRAGICQRVEQHEFSTIRPEYCRSGGPLLEGIGPYWRSIPREMDDRLEWLNHPAPREAEKLVSRGLRRATFKFTTSSNDQALLRLLTGSYGIRD